MALSAYTLTRVLQSTDGGLLTLSSPMALEDDGTYVHTAGGTTTITII